MSEQTSGGRARTWLAFRLLIVMAVTVQSVVVHHILISKSTGANDFCCRWVGTRS